MAMPTQSIALFLAEHVREPFVGPVMCYGQQAMNLPLEGALWLFERLGLTPHPDGLIDPPLEDHIIDFRRIVRMLGLGETHILDVSPYQDADIIADLNEPMPPELLGRFGLILDGGTMEHVFDIRQGMKNTADMLRPGGRALHITPVNNYVNHGFVQVSPTLYHDYYVANGFEDVRGIMIVHPRDQVFVSRWNFFYYQHETMGGFNSMLCAGETQLAVYFTARKNETSTSDKVPMQSAFARLHDGHGIPVNQILITHDVANLRIEQLPKVAATDPPVAINDIVHFS
jgi:SAM-dependent methyltransferase